MLAANDQPEPHIRQRRDGRWEASYDLPDCYAAAPTRAEAVAHLRLLYYASADHGRFGPVSR